MPDTNLKLNPEVRTTTIGVRRFREISIYPLSFGEQKKLTKTISDGLTAFFATGKGMKTDEENVVFVNHIIGSIEKNIEKVIEITTDENPENVINDITNEQLAEFAIIIYEMNYKPAIKKFKGLIRTIKETMMEGAEDEKM